MTGLFSFDGPLYKDRNGVYCSVTLTNEMFNRYFTVADRLIVAVRIFETDYTYKELNLSPLETACMKIVEVPNLNCPSGIFMKKKRFLKNIAEFVKRSDMIFARMPSTTSDAVLEVARKMKKRYLVEVGGCAWDAFWNHGISGKVIAPYMFLNEKRNIAMADYAVYVTSMFLQRRYPNKNVTEICSNVYVNKNEEYLLEERIRKIRNSKGKLVLGQAVNSIDVKYKGEHLVIRALSRLKKKGIQAEFQVAGPGAGRFLMKEAKRYGVESQLKLIGVLSKEEIYEWYKKIDLYIQPSKQAGLPRAMIEAMSTACPAIGSNRAGIPELLNKECLFNPDNINEICEAVIRITNKKQMLKMAKRNFLMAKQFNWKEIEKRRQRIFRMYRDSLRPYAE